MFDFNDLSKFSEEVVTFKEGWEDNRWTLMKPGTKFVGVIERVHDIIEYDGKKDGKKYLLANVDISSIDPPGTLIKEVRLYGQPKKFGNKRSDIEDLLMSAKMPYKKERTNREIVEAIGDIWNSAIHIGFDISWQGSSNGVFKETLMARTQTETYEDAKQVATKDDYNEARKEARVTSKDFKVNGEYEAKIPCTRSGNNPETGEPNYVYAEIKLKNLYQADDVDNQLGG
jgi:hypothetical protein